LRDERVAYATAVDHCDMYGKRTPSKCGLYPFRIHDSCGG
jgi:hypothetical protein